MQLKIGQRYYMRHGTIVRCTRVYKKTMFICVTDGGDEWVYHPDGRFSGILADHMDLVKLVIPNTINYNLTTLEAL